MLTPPVETASGYQPIQMLLSISVTNSRSPSFSRRIPETSFPSSALYEADSHVFPRRIKERILCRVVCETASGQPHDHASAYFLNAPDHEIDSASRRRCPRDGHMRCLAGSLGQEVFGSLGDAGSNDLVIWRRRSLRAHDARPSHHGILWHEEAFGHDARIRQTRVRKRRQAGTLVPRQRQAAAAQVTATQLTLGLHSAGGQKIVCAAVFQRTLCFRSRI